MKTTLVINDQVMRRVKQEAAKQGYTISEFVEDALRMMLKELERGPRKDLPPLPVYDAGLPLVDIANRDALYRAMEEEEPKP